MNWRTGRPPEDGWYWMEYDGGRKRIERYWVGDKYNHRNYAELVGWLGPLRPEDAEELERLRATVEQWKTTAKVEAQAMEAEKVRVAELEAQFFACHDCLRYNEEENVALRNTRDKLETQLATAREELERLRATVEAKEKTLCHYEEQIAEDTQRIEELEAKLATARGGGPLARPR